MTSCGDPSAPTCPSSSQIARSHNRATAPRSWETSTIVFFAARNSLILAKHLCWKYSSPTASTSSTRRMSGSRCTATAKPRRMYMPLEYVFTAASKKRPMSANSSIAGIARSISLRERPRSEPLRYAFSRPLKSGWNPAPISRSAVTRPFTSSVPRVGFAVPASSLSRVDFPDPFAPTTPKDAPGSDRKSTRLNSSHVAISYAVFCLIRLAPGSTLFPYTTLFRSEVRVLAAAEVRVESGADLKERRDAPIHLERSTRWLRRAREQLEQGRLPRPVRANDAEGRARLRSEEHTSELQSRGHLVCRLLLDTARTGLYTLSLHDALPI